MKGVQEMTVREAMDKFKRNDFNTRVYVEELDDEEWRSIWKYYDSEVITIYPHNGDMVCQVKEAK